MRAIAGVVAAGVLAGGVALAPGFWGKSPSPLPSPPGRGSEGEGKPAPVNEFKGMQEREEVFEFAEKPKAAKEGDRIIITFASKGKCDATVSIVDKDGKIIRHLASGVLGSNAPWPFQQNSLAQKVEWDGLSDDFKKADAAGCKVRVGLGLRAAYDRSILSNPYFLQPKIDPNNSTFVFPEDKKDACFSGTGADGSIYVAAFLPGTEMYGFVGRVFSKDGKYLRTFFPPPAADLVKGSATLGLTIMATKWGDQVPLTDWLGPAVFYDNKTWHQAGGYCNPKPQKREVLLAALSKLAGTELRPGAPPKEVAWSAEFDMACKFPCLAADRARDELYVQMIYGFGGSMRFIGRTGERDKSWFTAPGRDFPCEHASVGPDGLFYSGGGYGISYRNLFRLDHDGKPVAFKKENTVHVPGGGGWWTRLPAAFKEGLDVVDPGSAGAPGFHTGGMHVAPSGLIVVAGALTDAKWAEARGFTKLFEQGPKPGEANIPGYRVRVIDGDGRILSPNAIGATPYVVHNPAMDRDGNIYVIFRHTLPAGQKTWDGFDAQTPSEKVGGQPKPNETPGFGSLVKFRGQGGRFPLNVGEARVKIGDSRNRGQASEIPGALWAYGGISSGQALGGGCSGCMHKAYDLDFFARTWVPSRHTCSVMVLDSNMNRIARLGRYGNIDDADPACGRLHFSCPQSVAVSDAALYVADLGNRRILRAALSYAAEETVPLP